MIINLTEPKQNFYAVYLEKSREDLYKGSSAVTGDVGEKRPPPMGKEGPGKEKVRVRNRVSGRRSVAAPA